jgi:tRNA (guanosine-2'-O-)-methyltransferase
LTQARLQKLRACLDRRQPDLTVVTDNVHKPHNVSAIVRTCDATGVFNLHAAMLPDVNFRARSGIAMGSDKWVNISVHDKVETALQQLKAEQFRIVAVHKSPRSRNFREVDYLQKTAILFGAEKFGVSAAGAELADEHVVIPMMGMVESYNVSVAAAVVLLEAQRQREQAGCYERVRLDPQIYADTLFRWYRPQEADWCDRHGVPYPEMNDEGNLVDPEAFAIKRQSESLLNG